jgi:hypothetical protein
MFTAPTLKMEDAVSCEILVPFRMCGNVQNTVTLTSTSKKTSNTTANLDLAVNLKICLKGARFDSRFGTNIILAEVLRGLPQALYKIPGQYLKLVDDCSLSHPS